MFALDYAHENQLLASLPDEELQLLTPHLEWVDLPLGKVIHESGIPRKFVYFPTSAIVSLLYTTEGGASSEIAVVGREGAVGICVFLGANPCPSATRCAAQAAATGFAQRPSMPHSNAPIVSST
ncbi:Crp/Fnr family transcriptional regulator [Methyloversatilis sp.]|uniref:Crp/Fnr family transcriptional regulator n=1 Tax=Methyloversatilis sp. TaxID=2569862 RepID=UPI0035242D5C